MDDTDTYWKGRWERGETGWHQAEHEPLLVERFTTLAPTRVLVPLCGKSLDLLWLASRGHEVVGVELSKLACETFFTENKLELIRDESAGYPVYRSGRIVIHNTNMLSVTSAAIGPFGAIYDRAALIALSPDIRTRYAARLMELARSQGQHEKLRFLVIVLERTPADSKGPPFSVSRDELERLYGAHFRVRPIGREQVAMADSASLSEECVYELETQWS